MNVSLQYPWKFPDSPYYKYLINYPPKSIDYINVKKEKFDIITSAKQFKYMNFIKNRIRKGLSIIKIPNITYTKNRETDLIHCAHCLSLNKFPWIVDTENYWNFAASGKIAYSNKGKNIIKKFLSKEYCKKILPWTEECKNLIIKYAQNKEIKNKVEVVYPAVPLPKAKKIKHEGINLLFIGRYFYPKGGLVTLEVFNYLTKKYNNVKAIFVSETPKEILKRYSKNKKIKFYSLMSQNNLFNSIYPKSDIFVYPGYSDSFGFAMLEAMSFGLPVVTVDGFAKKEIVEDGRTGLIVEKPHDINYKDLNHDIINKLIENCSKIIENTKLRKRMSKNCINIIKGGKFSIKERNKKLERIYKEALTK